jgi:hypothetical protein
MFYDTLAKAFLEKVTFRNFKNNDYAIKFLDSSDHYLPQCISGMKGVLFQNISVTKRIFIGSTVLIFYLFLC